MTHIDIVFTGPPGPTGCEFVEVEDHTGRSIRFGEWVTREDGYTVLRFTDSRAELLALRGAVDEFVDGGSVEVLRFAAAGERDYEKENPNG